MVEVLVLSAYVDHSVDRRRPAQNLATRPVDRRPPDAWVGFGFEHPVDLRVGEGLAEAQRYMDPKVIVFAAGFQQHDLVGASSDRRAAMTQPAEPAPTTT